MSNIPIKAVAIGLIYLGCMFIVASVKLPKDTLLFPMSCLLGLGLLNIFFHDKLKSKFWWYQPLIIGATVALVISPFVLLSVIKTAEGG